MNQPDAFTLTDEQRQSFVANGHVLLRSVAGEEDIERSRRVIRLVSQKLNTETRKIEDRDTYGQAFLQTTNLWTHDETVRDFVFSKRYADIAASLLGVEKVRLYHDQALFKEAGGGQTPWHQDQYYWPLKTDRTITMWMPLIDIDDSMGMLTFASGSHRSGPIGSQAISDESQETYDKYVRNNKLGLSHAASMKAGDATFHLGWTIHCAGKNSSDRLREIMTIIYFEDGARVALPQNDNQAADLNAWLGGVSPGEFADGPLNPILN